MSGDTDAIEKAIDVASNRDVVHVYLQYGVYNSPVPATFLRSAPSITAHTSHPTSSSSTGILKSHKPEECLTIIITSEFGRGMTGVSHRGTLEPGDCDDATPLDVVVKLAFSSEERDALRSEYKIYRRLKSKGVHKGIATALGLFDDHEGSAVALVLLYAGVPLSESQIDLSTSDRKSALSTLKSIHHAGIVHGNIHQSHILTGDSGVTIIDFGYSEVSDNRKAKDRDLAQLRRCLDLES